MGNYTEVEPFFGLVQADETAPDIEKRLAQKPLTTA